MTRAVCRTRTGDAVPRTEKFGDLKTADHKFLSEHCESQKQSPSCSRGTRFGHSMDTISQEMVKSLRKFLEPSEKPNVTNTDNSLEFGKACEELSWNAVLWNSANPVKNSHGTSAVLLQSGLDEKWWADSLKCLCNLGHVQDLVADGKTPHERRFGEPFSEPTIPFGSMIEYHPISAKDQSRLHQFGKKVSPGIFFGYALYVGGLERRRHGRRR